MAQEFHCDLATEKKRYELHTNSDEQGYTQFLQKIIQPTFFYLTEKKIKIEQALDYGCGPNPRLAQLVREKSISCAAYDPYFYPEKKQDRYPLIFCTEVVEHFRQPRSDWLKLIETLSFGGVLGLMTQFHSGAKLFPDWWYVRDFTHISFYSQNTIEYLAKEWNLKIFKNESSIMIAQKMQSD